MVNNAEGEMIPVRCQESNRNGHDQIAGSEVVQMVKNENKNLATNTMENMAKPQL